MALLQVELVVRAEDVGVADHGVPGHAEPAEELAHLLDVELGPAAAEIVDMHFLRGVPFLFAPWLLARLIHHRAAEEDEMADLRVEAATQQQRVHDGIVRHMNVWRGHDVARPGGRGGRLDHYVEALKERTDGSSVAQIGLVPGHAGKVVGRPGEANGVDLEVGTARQGLHEIAADKAGGTADEDALTWHGVELRQWPDVAPLPLCAVGS